MKFTPEEILNEAPAQPGGKPTKEKPERGARKRRRQGEQEELEQDVPEAEGESPEDGEEGENNAGGPGIAYKIKMFFLLLIVTIGFLLFAVNIKGFIDSMRIDNVDYSTESVEGEDETGKDGAPLDSGQTATGGETTDGNTPDGTGSTQPQEKGGTTDGAQAEGPGSISKQEADKLKQEAQDAKNKAATMEQELNNTKALLEASQAREAQLRGAQEGMDAPDGGK